MLDTQGTISWNLEIEWPEPFQAVVQLVAALNLEVPYQCIFSREMPFFTRVYVVAGLPLAVGVLIWLAYGLRVAISITTATWGASQAQPPAAIPENDAHAKNRRKIFRQHSTATLLLMYMVIPVVSQTLFQSLHCSSLTRSSGKKFLRVDTAVSCTSGRYKEFRAVVAVLILVYLSILGLIALSLFMNRKSINPRGISDPSLRMHIRNSDPSIAYLSFLFSDYTCDHYLFELCDM